MMNKFYSKLLKICEANFKKQPLIFIWGFNSYTHVKFLAQITWEIFHPEYKPPSHGLRPQMPSPAQLSSSPSRSTHNGPLWIPFIYHTASIYGSLNMPLCLGRFFLLDSGCAEECLKIISLPRLNLPYRCTIDVQVQCVSELQSDHMFTF